MPNAIQFYRLEIPTTSGTRMLNYNPRVNFTNNLTAALISGTGNQPDQIRLSFTVEGDNGPEGVAWRFSASVTGAATDVQWTSSLDGSLGQGTDLSGITLSSGTHLITCTANYAGKPSISATTAVLAGTLPDLRLRAGDLTTSPTGGDPAFASASMTPIRCSPAGAWNAGHRKPDRSLPSSAQNCSRPPVTWTRPRRMACRFGIA